MTKSTLTWERRLEAFSEVVEELVGEQARWAPNQTPSVHAVHWDRKAQSATPVEALSDFRSFFLSFRKFLNANDHAFLSTILNQSPRYVDNAGLRRRIREIGIAWHALPDADNRIALTEGGKVITGAEARNLAINGWLAHSSDLTPRWRALTEAERTNITAWFQGQVSQMTSLVNRFREALDEAEWRGILVASPLDTSGDPPKSAHRPTQTPTERTIKSVWLDGRQIAIESALMVGRADPADGIVGLPGWSVRARLAQQPLPSPVRKIMLSAEMEDGTWEGGPCVIRNSKPDLDELRVFRFVGTEPETRKWADVFEAIGWPFRLVPIDDPELSSGDDLG